MRYIILLLFFTSCHEPIKSNNCIESKNEVLGKFEISIPKCYVKYYPDSLIRSKFYLIKDDSIKLEISTDGLISLDGFIVIQQNNDSITVHLDTIGDFLRQIVSYKNQNGFGFYAGIIDLESQDKTIFSDGKDFENNPLANHNHLVKLYVNTPRDVYLTMNEITRLTLAFKNIRIL